MNKQQYFKQLQDKYKYLGNLENKIRKTRGEIEDLQTKYKNEIAVFKKADKVWYETSEREKLSGVIAKVNVPCIIDEPITYGVMLDDWSYINGIFEKAVLASEYQLTKIDI